MLKTSYFAKEIKIWNEMIGIFKKKIYLQVSSWKDHKFIEY